MVQVERRSLLPLPRGTKIQRKNDVSQVKFSLLKPPLELYCWGLLIPVDWQSRAIHELDLPSS